MDVDLSQWPRVNRTGYVRPTRTVVLPWRWEQMYDDDVRTILFYGGAENMSHAVILAVHEMAERLRKEN